MKFKLILLALLNSLVLCNWANPKPATSKNDSIYLPDFKFENNLDSMYNLWIMQNANANDETAIDEDIVSDIDSNFVYSAIPDSVYMTRLRNIPSIIPLTYNKTVRNFIEMYLFKKRYKVEEILGLMPYYFPLFDEIIDSYNMPYEFKNLAIIESALIARAKSRAKAVGLWQFMYGTGKMYGLQINSLIDERRDPYKSTDAAMRYLRDLHKVFNDWHLAIAAYNCGPGNVRKAIRRSGGKTNFWEIYAYLPRETRGYVPAFIAANYVFTYYKEHGISAKSTKLPITNDTIMIDRYVHLGQIADKLNIEIDFLRDMNPQYTRDIIPARIDFQCPLKLSSEMAIRFIDKEEEIYAHKDTFYLNLFELNRQPQSYQSSYIPQGEAVRIRHTVRNGDNLGAIAMKYKVRVSDLKDWNNIRGNTIRVGQRLNIYVSKSKAKKFQKTESSTNPSIENTNGYILHTVKSGDTLWNIAQLYPGTSADDIMKLNNMSSYDKIQPGQKLKIQKAN